MNAFIPTPKLEANFAQAHRQNEKLAVMHYSSLAHTPLITPKVSIETGQPVEWTEEDNYKFRLSAYTEPLLKWLTENEMCRFDNPASVEFSIDK
jgi:hypothetical protein